MNLNKWVTENKRFKYKEFFVSSKHPEYMKDVYIEADYTERIHYGVEAVLDPIALALEKRFKKKVPVIITSGFRTVKLNKKLRGANDSDHTYMCAVDFVTRPLIPSIHLRDMIITDIPMLPFRQLIGYQRKPHIHVSWNIPEKHYRRELFTL